MSTATCEYLSQQSGARNEAFKVVEAQLALLEVQRVEALLRAEEAEKRVAKADERLAEAEGWMDVYKRKNGILASQLRNLKSSSQ